jgi:hypothetical protein
LPASTAEVYLIAVLITPGKTAIGWLTADLQTVVPIHNHRVQM